MKQRATIYPYGKDDVQIFRYAHLISEFEPVFPVAPPGWGQAGMNATKIDGGQPCGCIITTDLEMALEQTELLVLTSFKQFHGEKGNFDAAIELAFRKEKDVLILELPEVYDQNKLDALRTGGRLKKIYSELKQLPQFNNGFRKKVEVPVVLVFGEGPFTDKFEVQLALRDELLKRNYRVTQIGSRSYGELFGFHSFPAFMRSTSLTEAEKIIRFNEYLKKLEAEEKPNLMFIGVPQGMIPVTDEVHNDFGMLLLEVAAASEPDILVNTMYQMDYRPDYFALKAKQSFAKLGSEVGCFVLSNTWLDVMGTILEKNLKTMTFRKTRSQSVFSIQLQTKNLPPVISLQQPGAAQSIANAVISRLQNFAEVNIV